jgi:hypothetical protein
MMHISKSLRTRAIEIQLSRCYTGHLNGKWGSKLLVFIGSLWPWELGVLDFQTNPYLSIVQSYFFAGTCKYRYTNTMMVCAIWKKHKKVQCGNRPKIGCRQNKNVSWTSEIQEYRPLHCLLIYKFPIHGFWWIPNIHVYIYITYIYIVYFI